MIKLKLEKDIIVKRMDGIESEIADLNKLAEKSLSEFTTGDGWKLAQFHLHRALEGVFNIGSHILSRIPGATATQYKEIALKLAEFHIVPKEYAEKKFDEMAKYRKRFVHYYTEVSPEELYKIIKENLGDFNIFLSSVKKVLTDPQQFDLEVE